jgi:hypothetical protein
MNSLGKGTSLALSAAASQALSWVLSWALYQTRPQALLHATSHACSSNPDSAAITGLIGLGRKSKSCSKTSS